MPRMDVVPIKQLERRAPEAGRIRIGIKTANTGQNARSKDRPTSIKTFRFTSLHKDLIEQLAARYGGDVVEWDEPDAKYRHQWQVVSEVSQIRVYLPKNGLSQDMELWVHGGRQRQCDGETVETVKMGPDGTEFQQSPCICAAKGVRECQIKTRITVIIPELPFFGVWRLDTGSWAAAHELPGMFEMTVALQESTLVDAILGVEPRTDRVAGKTRHYVVPTLALNVSPLEIQAGMANVQAIAAGNAGALPAGAAKTEQPVLQLQERNGHHASDSAPLDEVPETGNPDDDIVDGEIVEPGEERHVDMHDSMLTVHAIHAGLDAERFVAAVRAMPAPVEKILEDLASGFITPLGFNPTGTIKWKQNTGA